MSASLVVDIGNTCDVKYSINPLAIGSDPRSGSLIGNPVDLQYANTLCNVFAGIGAQQSGTFTVQIQSSPDGLSGTFTDPTSGLAAFPSNILSGGLMIVGSGAAFTSGGYAQSGGAVWGTFQRPYRYVRANILSGSAAAAPSYAGFLSQRKATGANIGGFTYSPTSGTPSV